MGGAGGEREDRQLRPGRQRHRRAAQALWSLLDELHLRAGQFDLVALGRGQAAMPGQRAGQQADAVAVVAGVGIAQLQRHRQRVDGAGQCGGGVVWGVIGHGEILPRSRSPKRPGTAESMPLQLDAVLLGVRILRRVQGLHFRIDTVADGLQLLGQRHRHPRLDDGPGRGDGRQRRARLRLRRTAQLQQQQLGRQRRWLRRHRSKAMLCQAPSQARPPWAHWLPEKPPHRPSRL